MQCSNFGVRSCKEARQRKIEHRHRDSIVCVATFVINYKVNRPRTMQKSKITISRNLKQICNFGMC